MPWKTHAHTHTPGDNKRKYQPIKHASVHATNTFACNQIQIRTAQTNTTAVQMLIQLIFGWFCCFVFNSHSTHIRIYACKIVTIAKNSRIINQTFMTKLKCTNYTHSTKSTGNLLINLSIWYVCKRLIVLGSIYDVRMSEWANEKDSKRSFARSIIYARYACTAQHDSYRFPCYIILLIWFLSFNSSKSMAFASCARFIPFQHGVQWFDM